MAFIETPRFPEDISYGASGGPGYKTDVVVVDSGFEKRNITWADARAVYDVAHGLKTPSQLATLIAYFRAMKGRAHGFRYKDWADFAASLTTGYLGTGVGTGYPTYQLNKYYAAGSLSELRKITKPVTGATLYSDSVAQGSWTLNTTTGVATTVATSTKTITGITQANPGVVTATAHGFSNGDLIYISGVVGMTQVNLLVFTIAGVTANTFSIGVNTTAYGAYSSAGTAAKFSQPANVLRWVGDFDVPCRFDTDEMRVSIDDFNAFTWGQIPVVEVRI